MESSTSFVFPVSQATKCGILGQPGAILYHWGVTLIPFLSEYLPSLGLFFIFQKEKQEPRCSLGGSVVWDAVMWLVSTHTDLILETGNLTNLDIEYHIVI